MNLQDTIFPQRPFMVAVVCAVCFLLGYAGSVQGDTAVRLVDEIAAGPVVDSVVSACLQFRGAAISVESTESVPSIGDHLAARSSKQQDFVFAASRKLFRALASVDRGGERVFQSYEHLVRSDGERVYVQCELEEGFSDLLHPPSAVLFSNAVASKDVQSLDGLLNGLNDVAVVFWYVGYRPVQDYFKEAVRVREEDDEFVISCSGKFGEAEFRVSESTGYLPRMFEITLRRDVTVGEITVGEMLGSFPSSDGLTIAGTASRFHATPDGTIIPSAIHVQRSVSQDDQSREFLLATTIEIKSIEFNPSIGDDEFRPRLPLPANTLVGARDASHLDFIWDGKWVVPKVQPVSYLEVQGRGWSFQILLAFNVLTIAAALIIIILRRQNQLSHPP